MVHAAKIAENLKLHPIVADMLLRRGFKSEAEIFSFLNPSLDSLESPFAFEHMAKAAARIQKAIADKEKILIYGDYDVDGVTGSAILFKALKDLGAEVQAHVPHRVKEGYGLNLESLKPWVSQKISLVITVDNGITGIKPVQFLKEKNVDVIIVDHHLPKEGIPPADAIISAAVNDKKGDPNLAACGLAFKLVWALTGSPAKAMESLDLVTIGTVADLAPVLGDNRILLKHGLLAITQSKKTGLRALMESAGIHPARISYRDLAFGLGPRINASGRMGSPLNAFKLLITENAVEARNLAGLLEEGNRDRQRVEAQAYQDAAKLVENQPKIKNRCVLVVQSPDWHEGVLGIVAARLAERFKKPSIVISMKGGLGKGSGRSIPAISIFDWVLKCEDLLESFGGHSQACGLTIRENRIEEFRDRLNEDSDGAIGAALRLDPTPSIDAEIRPSELNLSLVADLEKLAPFGPGNPAPHFLSRQMRVRGDVKKRGKDTLQCWMTDEKGLVTCEVVGFRAYEKWQKDIQRKSRFDIVYRPALKNFNGIETIQLELESWE